MPGDSCEVAPFVVDAGPVAALPERSEIEVSAAMSPQPDLSRSFRYDFIFHPWATSSWDAPWVSRYLAEPDFALNRAAMELPLGPGDRIRYWATTVDPVEPNSHPGVAGAADQVIEDMRAYLTFLDEHGRVFAVHRLTPLNTRADPTEPLSGLPIIASDGDRDYRFRLKFVWLAGSEYDTGVQTVMHIGAADP